MPGIAVVCDAEITIAGPRGLNTVAAGDFFIGALSTVLQPDELTLTELGGTGVHADIHPR